MDNDPDNPVRWANWGVALYKNNQYPEAIDAFRFGDRGGETKDGFTVVGIPLDYSVAEYFYMYALALASTRQCAEAIPIFQALQTIVPGDQIAMDNADYGIELRESYVNEPTAAPHHCPYRRLQSGRPTNSGGTAKHSLRLPPSGILAW